MTHEKSTPPLLIADEAFKALFEPTVGDDGALISPPAVMAVMARRICTVMCLAADVALLRIVRNSGDALERSPELNLAIIDAGQIMDEARAIAKNAIERSVDPVIGLAELERRWAGAASQGERLQ